MSAPEPDQIPPPPRLTWGDQLDYINSHASAAGDDALEEAADDSDPQDRRWRRPGN